MLDLALLERIQELRNQFKEPYVPSDLSKKEDLQEKDFLFTDSDERNKLLKETRQLGLFWLINLLDTLILPQKEN